MSRHVNPLAYSIAAKDPAGGDMRPTAHIKCGKCGRIGTFNVAGIGNNPNLIERGFIRLGWDCNVHKPAECICPVCVKQREIRREGESPKAPVVIPAKAPTPGLMDNVRIGAGTRSQSNPSTSKGDVPMTLKDLPAAQKTSLRTALESYFDPDRGAYTDGMNDHRVSEELGVPRVLVVEFRETFYGELKEDPEIKAFRQQMEDAKKIMSNLQASLTKMETKLAELLRKNGL